MSARLDAALAGIAAAHAEYAAALLEELRAAIGPGTPDRLLSIPEAAQALGGIGRTSLYAELQAGRLRSVKVGRRRLVPSSAVSEYAQRVGRA